MLTATLTGSVGVASAATGNRLSNPGFEDGMNAWEFQLAGGALAFPNSTSGALCTSFADAGSGAGDVLLLQRRVPLAHAGTYRLRFTASADANRSIQAHVGNRETPFVTYGSLTVNLTPVPQGFQTIFTMDAASDPCGIVAFRLGGQGTAGVCIDDVLFQEITPPPPSAPTPPLFVPPAAPQPLRSFADAIGFGIGTAVREEPLFCEADYAQVLAREYNQISPELSLLFSALRPEAATYSFHTPDEIVDYALQHGMAARGHTLVWHEALPPWLVYGQFGPAQLAQILQSHVQTVVGHYAGRIAAWNVVNEAIDYDGSLRDTLWLQALGPSYIDQAFQWAHAADPQATLIYNDFDDEGLEAKSDGVFALVQGMVQRGVPIDGVGFQSHFELDFPIPSPEEIAANMDRYAALGIDVYITEMDVAIHGDPSPDDLAAQATVYGEMLAVCLQKPNCRALVTHGFTDKHSWVSELLPAYGAALPFDEEYAAKPAYYALYREFARKVHIVPSVSFLGSLVLAALVLLAGVRRLSRR
jgi:endo-1,4-beta-xylanase